MAGNVEYQLFERVKKSAYYTLQINETTDVTNDANLMCYAVELCQPEKLENFSL
jgi:hypothetical protein